MHIYTTAEGKSVPSVTTVLDVLGSKEIIKWANYLGFKHVSYEDELNASATKGTKAHIMLQHLVDPSLGKLEVQYRDVYEERYYSRVMENFLKEISQYDYSTIFTEKTLVSDKLGYGGTLDWYANMNGLMMLNDFKTSKKVRIKHLFQLGGYYNLMIDDGYNVDGGAIIIANDINSKLFPINKTQLEEFGIVFNMLRKVYDLYNEASIIHDPNLLNNLKRANLTNL